MRNQLGDVLADSSDPSVRIEYGTATGVNQVALSGESTAVILPAVTPVRAGEYCAVAIMPDGDRLILGPIGSFGTTGWQVNSLSFSSDWYWSDVGGGNKSTFTGTAEWRVRDGLLHMHMSAQVAVAGGATTSGRLFHPAVSRQSAAATLVGTWRGNAFSGVGDVGGHVLYDAHNRLTFLDDSGNNIQGATPVLAGVIDLQVFYPTTRANT